MSRLVTVLILVLMEDALVHPCLSRSSCPPYRVLILVLMEDALVRVWNEWEWHEVEKVLILVLMEDALVHVVNNVDQAYIRCLNPCFNGRCTRTTSGSGTRLKRYSSLNPCFNGRCTRTTFLNP